MEHFRRDDWRGGPSRTGSSVGNGRNDAHSPSENMTVGFAHYSAERDRWNRTSTPRGHLRDRCQGWLGRVGPEKDS